MATEPPPSYAFDPGQTEAAAKRWAKRGEQQAAFETARVTDTFFTLDTPERRAKRAGRLVDKLKAERPEALPALADKLVDAAHDHEAAESMVADDDVAALGEADTLERVLGATRDFLGIEFLARGLQASRAVGRVVLGGAGRPSYGTGFLVSPRLLLTNHHVLTSAGAAAGGLVEFDYQRDVAGREQPRVGLRLDPAAFFLNDKKLDYALVAVTPDARLAGFGWLPLVPTEGKIVKGEPVCVIQHPLGELKQVVLSENRLIDLLDHFVHYQADTEPGSSGSPVFNTQWEVFALHHSGVPATFPDGRLKSKRGGVWKKDDPPTDLEWVANEGVRVSVLVKHLAGRTDELTAPQQKLLRKVLDGQPPPDPVAVVPPPPSVDDDRETTSTRPPKETVVPTPAPNGSVTLTVPLTITLSFGPPGANGSVAALAQTSGHTPEVEGEEAIVIDPDFAGRTGYDPDFLGVRLPFPRLTRAVQTKGYEVPGATGADRFVLKYHHYSVLFNKERKLAFCAGVNYDPTAEFTVKRGKDKWFFDPRVKPQGLQCGEDLYARNPLDRGHLVRRADAGWGHTQAEADRANNDTFHFTNCSPQHAVTNQGKTGQAPPGLRLWGKLEDHVAAQGKQGKRKVSIFNGPVFGEGDEMYRNICKLPKEFWKVVAFLDDGGEPGAVAFILTQEPLIEDLEEEFRLGQFKAVQVAVSDLERTKLDFGVLTEWDVFNTPRAVESTGGAEGKVIESLTDVVL